MTLAEQCVGCEGKPTPENSPCAVCGALRPQALPEDVRGLLDTWNHIADNIRPIKPDTLRAAISFITTQQATIQEMAGEVERLREALALQTEQQAYPCSPHCAGYLREQGLRADLDEAVALLERIDEETESEPDYRHEVYSYLAKHQPKDPADGR